MFWGVIFLWESSGSSSGSLLGWFYAKTTLLESHGMQLGHWPNGSLGNGLLGESWFCCWEIGGGCG